MFMVRAKIAVWELALPCSVTNPNTMDLSNCTVSLGARSVAAIMDGSVNSTALFPAPDKISSNLSEMSFTSAARPCI